MKKQASVKEDGRLITYYWFKKIDPADIAANADRNTTRAHAVDPETLTPYPIDLLQSDGKIKGPSTGSAS